MKSLSLHEQIVGQWAAGGWETKGLMKTLRKFTFDDSVESPPNTPEWAIPLEDMDRVVAGTRCIPDLWRIWQHKDGTPHLEIIEVGVSGGLERVDLARIRRKLRRYTNWWWFFDSHSWLFDVYRISAVEQKPAHVLGQRDPEASIRLDLRFSGQGAA